ncbi:MAG: UDP-3-O-(3-hydroxymyristoyl)glucosamine N-acyltransferase [Acidobacteriota bacterium]
MRTLQQLADYVDGEAVGDPSVEIVGVRPFAKAGPGEITLAAGKPYQDNPGATKASAVIVSPAIECPGKALLRVSNPKLAFARILSLFHQSPFEALGISPLASIGEGCRISAEVSIHSFVSIGRRVVIEDGVTLFPGVCVGENCRIGRGSVLHPNVTLYPRVRLGRHVIVHGGSVIGSDGFGYVLDGTQQFKIPQTGWVEIRDEVEIGANSCIDRATFGATVVERGVKIDNLVHVGHNCRIGENTVIVGCVGISGSVEIGKNCVLAGQSGVIDHIKIGDNVTVMVKTGVTKNIPSGSTVSGIHGRDHRRELRSQAALRKLPEIYREWRELKSKLRDKRQEEDQRGDERSCRRD